MHGELIKLQYIGVIEDDPDSNDLVGSVVQPYFEAIEEAKNPKPVPDPNAPVPDEPEENNRVIYSFD